MPTSIHKEREINFIEESRTLFAELVGTFALTFVAAGGIVISEVSHYQVEYVARVASPGLLVMAMIYTISEISGAHINPAVTLAFALRRGFLWFRVPGYWIAQSAGAVLAAFVLYVLFGSAGDNGATLPHYGTISSFIMEIILTTLLIIVIIGTATGHRIVGPNAGIAVGATISLCGLFADPIGGASMNPARSFRPAVISGKLDVIWIYIFGPFVGALLAVVFSWMLKGSPTEHEKEVASGTGTKKDKR